MHHTTYRVVNLVPLPCWGDLPAEQYRERIAELVEAIIAKAAARRAETGIEPLGRATILRQHPFSQPAKTKKSPVGPRRKQEDPSRGQDRLRWFATLGLFEKRRSICGPAIGWPGFPEVVFLPVCRLSDRVGRRSDRTWVRAVRTWV